MLFLRYKSILMNVQKRALNSGHDNAFKLIGNLTGNLSFTHVEVLGPNNTGTKDKGRISNCGPTRDGTIYKDNINDE